MVSIGCPAGVGPEVSVAAALRYAAGEGHAGPGRTRVRGGRPSVVLVGDSATLRAAVDFLGVGEHLLVPFATSADGAPAPPGAVFVYDPGVRVTPRDRTKGAPTRRAGAAQLTFIEAAYGLTRALPRAALVTGPVSKEAIARSGVPGSETFLGHTEWLQALDGAKTSVMCFASQALVTSLVTTHLPLSAVPSALTRSGVKTACLALAELLAARGHVKPTVAVCSLNPHAGEGELLGAEERTAIAPGIAAARRACDARFIGPIGAETAYRKAARGEYAGVVAMYHDQATIPMKLLAFGDAVNITMGLSIVRTSVDHGTGYDIAWRGTANPSGMLSALVCAEQLLARR